jgi:serine/threonine protein kinase
MLFRFRKSIRAMRLLSEHKRLEKFPDARGSVVEFSAADASELAFSMQLLPNGSLDDIARRGWTLEHKLDACTRVCTAVAYSHASGVIHRDIKPANIVLNEEGLAVLTDFDIADIKFATSMSTTVEGGLGTPVFAAPEQLLDAERADERSDVYSIGRLLHYMLLERSPGYQVEKDPALENLAGFPAALVEIVRRATQHEVGRRFASVREFQDALLKSRTGAAAWRARMTRLRRWLRYNWAAATIVALIVCVSGVVAILQTKAAASQRAAALREARFSDELSQLTEKLNQSIKQKDAAIDRVAKINAELVLLQNRPQSVARDQLITDAETRLASAQQAVDDLTVQQRSLSKLFETELAAVSTPDEPKPGKPNQSPPNRVQDSSQAGHPAISERTAASTSGLRLEKPLPVAGPLVGGTPRSNSGPYIGGSAEARLRAAAEKAAADCTEQSGMTGKGRAKIVYDPGGQPTWAAVVNPPFAGTPEGACIARALKRVTVSAELFGATSASVDFEVK